MEEGKKGLTLYFTSDGILLKIHSRATLEYCRNLKDTMLELLKNYNKINVYVDASEAVHMDSTFIGTLLFLLRVLREENKGDIIILSPSQRIIEILSTMDLLDVFHIENRNVNIIEKFIEIEPTYKRDIKELELILEAHKKLMETNPNNKKRFESIVNSLREELQKMQEEMGKEKGNEQ